MARFDVEREFERSRRDTARLVDALTGSALDRLDPARVEARERDRLRAAQAEREAADARAASLGRQLGMINASLRRFSQALHRGFQEGDRG